MGLKRFRKFRVKEDGLTILTFAILAPIFFALTFLAISLFYHFRIVSVVNHAAEVGAAIATSTEVYESVENLDSIDWRQYLEVRADNQLNSYLNSNYFIWDKCLGKRGNDVASCIASSGIGLWELLNGGLPTSASTVSVPVPIPIPTLKIWKDHVPGSFDGDGSFTIDKTEQLPWKLFENGGTALPGYNRVQYLPRVCIKAGCVESFNETGTAIGLAMPGSTTCTRTQTLCWNIDERLDFDGDGKEDIALFRATGQVAFQDIGGGEKSEIDWIVYHSGTGYTGPLTGQGYFNLGQENVTGSIGVGAIGGGSRTEDIPIPADYDRDGLADYAVFQPSRGKIKIAFSSRNYDLIWDYFLGSNFEDSSGVDGLVAIPGSFDNPVTTYAGNSPVTTPYESRRIGVAIFRTTSVANSPSARYQVTIVTPPDVSIIEAGLPQHSIVNSTTPPTINSTPDPITKPRPGMSSVPAFADYDKDGETEVGWLSWSAGNPTRHIGGKLNGDDVFETANGPANELRMNPFDIATSPDNRFISILYYLDAVQGTVWKLTNQNSTNLPPFLGNMDENVERVVNTIAGAPAFTGSEFPNYNVMNIPAGPPVTIPFTDAGSYRLNSPRRMVSGPDGALYVADWGNSALVRFGRLSGSGAVTPFSRASKIISAPTCTGTCVMLPHLSGDTLPASSFGNLTRFNPIALAVVPDPDPAFPARYHLAFSDGNGVYFLRNDNIGANGPDGSAGETVQWLGGRAPASGGVPLVPGVTDALWATLAGDSPNAQICTIVDLAYDFTAPNATLYGASSCNTAQRPNELPDTLNLVSGNHPVAGGIIKFSNFFSGNADIVKVSLVAGNFWLAGDVCNSPSAKTPVLLASRASNSICQRKVNITPRGSQFWNSNNPLKHNDLFNPVSLVVDPLGNILFINQWNEQGGRAVGNPSQILTNNFTHGIYRINLQTNDIEPLTNPFSYGSYSLPIESGMWYSPGSRVHSSKTPDAWENMWVPPFRDAPIKNVPFPAVAAIEMSSNKQYLYSATPYMPANGWFTTPVAADKLSVDPSKVGFIFGVSLDSDGDTLPDFSKSSSDTWSSSGGYSDPDVDGDSVISGELNHEGSFRSDFVAEIHHASSDSSARVIERAGLPVQYFMRLDGQNIAVPNLAANSELFSIPSAQPKNIVEFPFINQLSSVGIDRAAIVYGLRPEAWSLLFDGALDEDDNLSTVVNTGYVYTMEDKNGPIAMPLPLHGIYGLGNCVAGKGCSAGTKVGSYPDNSGTTEITEFNQFLFPVVMGSGSKLESLRPVKRGKPPQVTGYQTIGQWKYTRSGALCIDYSYSNGTKKPFQSSLAGQALSVSMMFMPSVVGTYPFTTPLFSDTDDMVWYHRDCSVTTLAPVDPFSTDPVNIITEPIVLGLDRDDFEPESERDVDVQDGDGTNWPADWLSGGPDDDGRRAIIFLDHDGDSLRNPSWYSTPVVPPTSSGAQSYAFVVGTGGLLTKSLTSPNWNQSLTAFEIQRHPFSDLSAGTGFPLNIHNIPSHHSRIADTFRFMSEFGSTAPMVYPNTLFDPGWVLADPLNQKRSDGFVVALDREVIFPGAVPAVQSQVGNLGAPLLMNIPISNRFVWSNLISTGGLPAVFANCIRAYDPGLVSLASMAVLLEAVPVAPDHCKFGGLSTAESADLEPWAYVALKPEGCQGADPDQSCKALVVGYTHVVMGKVQKVSRRVEFAQKLGQVN